MFANIEHLSVAKFFQVRQLLPGDLYGLYAELLPLVWMMSEVRCFVFYFARLSHDLFVDPAKFNKRLLLKILKKRVNCPQYRIRLFGWNFKVLPLAARSFLPYCGLCQKRLPKAFSHDGTGRHLIL